MPNMHKGTFVFCFLVPSWLFSPFVILAKYACENCPRRGTNRLFVVYDRGFGQNDLPAAYFADNNSERIFFSSDKSAEMGLPK